MNHRTGPLTAADFDQSRAAPAPTFFVDPIEHTSDFGVLDVGSDFSAPPPRRMWQEEIDDPRLVRLYGWTFTAAIVASAVLARCAA